MGASSGAPAHSCFASQVVFEALHNLEPRGYVVGWIIAISLLVGILIFLLLAVLLWKVSGDRGSRESPPGQPALLPCWPWATDALWERMSDSSKSYSWEQRPELRP